MMGLRMAGTSNLPKNGCPENEGTMRLNRFSPFAANLFPPARLSFRAFLGKPWPSQAGLLHSLEAQNQNASVLRVPFFGVIKGKPNGQ